MLIEPRWSAKIDERGMPADPLNANRSRNRFRNLFAHGSITSITLRLRYLSIFCWALEELDADADNRYQRVKNVEKMFCLASRYRQLETDQGGEALRGMDGNSRFNFDHEEFEEVDLDELELLKNDGYAYAQFYQNQLQNYLLKRGDFELTGAGHELAEIVDRTVGDERDRILACARDRRAERGDIEAIARGFANQSVYLEDDFESERRALQQIMLGFVNWDGNKQSGTVQLADGFPENFELDVLEHLKTTIEEGEFEEAGASSLYQRYFRGFHDMRAAHACFLCRFWKLYAADDADQLHLTASDARRFNQYRELMRLYWLQSYAGLAIEGQLEAVCTFLNARIPPRADYETLLAEVTDERKMSAAFSAVASGVSTTQSEETADPVNAVRDLMLYGIAERNDLSITVPEATAAETVTVGEAMADIESVVSRGWKAEPAVAGETNLNEALLGQSLRSSLNQLHDEIDDEQAQLESWTTSLARSVALLLLVVARFKQVQSDREWLYNYAYNRFDSPYTSLPELTRFVEATDEELPLSEFARKVLHEKVVQTHMEVFYSRLSPGNLKRAVSFDQDERLCLEADVERGSRPFTARSSLIRFSEMNTLLRDAGLLTTTEDGYAPTSAASDVLSRLVEVDDA
ncbi:MULTISPECIES: hypothetical protein [Haloarcula]|uniref:hypothetical protein n=1 Tax=Haloarcula TaxID=2237 RepID=UPI0023EC1CE2|nr:hypothetical protein [Halomicroarcula sp. XH51]